MPRPKTQEEYIRNLKVIYDSFEVKDLTWEQFVKSTLTPQWLVFCSREVDREKVENRVRPRYEIFKKRFDYNLRKIIEAKEQLG